MKERHKQKRWEKKKRGKREREEGPCIYGTLCAELLNRGIRLACEVHRGETSSHTLKQKLKGCLEAHSTRRGTIKDTLRPAASTHTNLIPFMFFEFSHFLSKKWKPSFYDEKENASAAPRCDMCDVLPSKPQTILSEMRIVVECWWWWCV